MTAETIYLREDDKNIKMQTFIHDDASNVIAGKRAAMVVLAGGGYLFQANDRETGIGYGIHCAGACR